MLDIQWPQQLQTSLEAKLGEATAAQRLYGLSQNEVWLIKFANIDLILKSSTSGREARFYAQVGPILRKNDVAIPICYEQFAENGIQWLALEYVPRPFPKERWLADGEALLLLYRLHQTTLNNPPKDRFQPAWSDDLTLQAAQILAGSADDVQLLRRVAIECQLLFAGTSWLSGDPNPKNWGIGDGRLANNRLANNRLILFDWERFCQGDPAIDLAITVPGFGQKSDFEQVAHTYLAFGTTPTTANVTELTHKMILAKAWTIVEFLAAIYREQVGKTAVGIDHFQARFLPWLRQNF
ncbi:MAG: aminoglycoside phosphotransferase family protein [Chloroflexota bacterium]